MNKILETDNVRIHLLDKPLELHISGCGQSRHDLLQMVWKAAPGPKSQRKFLPIFGMIDGFGTRKITSAGAGTYTNKIYSFS